jgi:hypothetical protein
LDAAGEKSRTNRDSRVAWWTGWLRNMPTLTRAETGLHITWKNNSHFFRLDAAGEKTPTAASLAEKHGEAGKLKDAVITEVHINEGVEEKDFR